MVTLKHITGVSGSHLSVHPLHNLTFSFPKASAALVPPPIQTSQYVFIIKTRTRYCFLSRDKGGNRGAGYEKSFGERKKAFMGRETERARGKTCYKTKKEDLKGQNQRWTVQRRGEESEGWLLHEKNQRKKTWSKKVVRRKQKCGEPYAKQTRENEILRAWPSDRQLVQDPHRRWIYIFFLGFLCWSCSRMIFERWRSTEWKVQHREVA